MAVYTEARPTIIPRLLASVVELAGLTGGAGGEPMGAGKEATLLSGRTIKCRPVVSPWGVAVLSRLQLPSSLIRPYMLWCGQTKVSDHRKSSQDKCSSCSGH